MEVAGYAAKESVVKVLVVEESAVLTDRLVERLVETSGVRVIGTARTVLDAIRRIAVLFPDLVIADLDMEEGGGFALLNAIRILRQVEGSGPIVVLWTGCLDPRRLAHARELGVEATFEKARELDRLVEYCRSVGVAP
ncbi:MAG TPA: response regulator [Gemmatimonadales bacterium]|jgi:DNA-binding NarL/FixJ family response regulator|nr:response regulator [Gemmatimonadales bacterium]